jgi:hypothetical protein
MKAKSGYLFIFLMFAFGARAATFSVTPNVVSNDYSGLITFHMTGLSPGETVQLQQYYDSNSNGVVDSGEFCVRSELVTDGQAKLVNGATNINVFRDEDGLANGTIAASLRFTFAPDFARTVGMHIFRFSSPSNHFTAFNAGFTVVGLTYPQSIQGKVLSGGAPVGSGRVALVQNAASPFAAIIAGGTADANGNYSLQAPPGVYQVLAFRVGYVGSLAAFPLVTLLPNATVTTNVNLVAATSLISGSLVDSTNITLPAIPNAQLLVFSTNLLVTSTVADNNANFIMPVTPNNVWVVQPQAQSAMAQSYLLPDGANQAFFETFSGPANNATVALKHATALIYGRVQDNLGHPIAGASLFANADFGQYNAFGLSDTNGLFSLAIDAGIGNVSVQNSGNPPFNNYIWPTPQFGINNGQALSLNVTGLVATARFRGHIVDDTGAPLPNFQTVADSYEIYGAYTFAKTDNSGYFDMAMFGGRWNFTLLDAYTRPSLIFPDVPLLTITDGINLTNDFVARTVTGTVSGYVRDTGGHGITNLTVTVTNHVGLTNFTLHATTDTNGNYSVKVFNGTWNVSTDTNTLSGYGYIPVAATNVTVPPAGAVANFIVSSVPPPQILTTSLPDATINGYYSADLEVTNGSYPTFWSLTSGTLPDGLALNMFGFISGFPTNLGLFNFTLKVQDSQGSNDVKSLSIRVRPVPTGPPQILTTYLADSAVGCPYTNYLRATNGTAPYTWALAAGSDPLPPGLNLASDGTLYGIPSSNDYFSVTVQLSGADGSITNNLVTIQVNGPLQSYPAPLTPGVVGVSYYGAVYVSGGAQPQTWSLIAGALPPHLALDPATGYITGIPAAAGVSSFTLRVTDGCTTIDTATSFTNYPALQITTATLPIAPLNVPYSAQLQGSGGVSPYYWYAYSSLPYGLTLNLDGSITGTPYLEGTSEVTVQLYDAFYNGASRVMTIIVTSRAVLDLPTRLTPNQFTFRVTGTSGQGYTLQTAPDLTNWADLFTTNAPANVFHLTATNASGPKRYYRLKESP